MHTGATLEFKPIPKGFGFIQYKHANVITTCPVSYPDLLEGADQTRGKGLANLGRMYTLVYRVGGVLLQEWCIDVIQWV